MSMDPELLQCFIEESADLLTQWEAICLELEKAPSSDKWDALFRVAHNIKGTSRSVGLDDVGAFVHRVEDGITLAKQNKIVPDSGYYRALFAAQKELIDWVTAAQANPQVPFAPSDFEHHFRALLGQSTPEPTAVNEKTDVALLTPTETVATPVLESVQNSPQHVPNEIKPVGNSAFSEPLPSGLVGKTAPAPASTATPTATPIPDETIRVSARKLDALIQMVGEISIQQNVAAHRSHTSTSSHQDQAQYLLKKMTRDLYEKALSLRMQTVQPIFQRLDRTIRDISSTLNKQVNVSLDGSEVELDKTVCEKIIEPLTHMVRNSIDHGIESPEIRESSGKSRTGNIQIRAVQDTSSVSLIIEDDGKGLDPKKIRDKALERGLIKENTPLNPSEVFALIFLPGFSTAEKVTDVSGRGVGMDVVMRAIDSLRGEIQIASEVGKGTRFTITLPLSLTLIDAILIGVQGVEYAIPLDSIHEVVDLTSEHRDQSTMIHFNDRVIPRVQLYKYLKTHTKDQMLGHRAKKLLITRANNGMVAFEVDSVGEKQQIVARNLSQNIRETQGISGGTILSNGDPGLIVNIDQIARLYLAQNQSNYQEAA